MLCNMKVEKAKFNAEVRTTRELIFRNEIYPVDAVLNFEVSADIEFRNFGLSQTQDAWPSMEKVVPTLCAEVDSKVRSSLGERSFVLVSVTAPELDKWDVTLTESNDGRPVTSARLASEPTVPGLS